MPHTDKIKITIKELEDLYDIEDPDKNKQKEVNTDANATFEEFTEYFDKKEMEDRE